MGFSAYVELGLIITPQFHYEVQHSVELSNIKEDYTYSQRLAGIFQQDIGQNFRFKDA